MSGDNDNVRTECRWWQRHLWGKWKIVKVRGVYNWRPCMYVFEEKYCRVCNKRKRILFDRYYITESGASQ